MIYHLIDDIVYVRPALGSPDAVDKRDLEEGLGSIGDHDVPTIAGMGGRGSVHELGGIGGEITALDHDLVARTMLPVYLDILAHRHRQIAGPAAEYTEQVWRNLGETEPCKVGGPRDTDVRLGLACHDLGLVDHRHVVLPGLGILLARDGVNGLHRHLLRKDVGQLHAVAVLTAYELLLVLVVVRGGQELAKHQLRNPDLVFGMLSYGNTLSIILHRDGLVVL